MINMDYFLGPALAQAVENNGTVAVGPNPLATPGIFNCGLAETELAVAGGRPLFYVANTIFSGQQLADQVNKMRGTAYTMVLPVLRHQAADAIAQMARVPGTAYLMEAPDSCVSTVEYEHPWAILIYTNTARWAKPEGKRLSFFAMDRPGGLGLSVLKIGVRRARQGHKVYGSPSVVPSIENSVVFNQFVGAAGWCDTSDSAVLLCGEPVVGAIGVQMMHRLRGPNHMTALVTDGPTAAEICRTGIFRVSVLGEGLAPKPFYVVATE